MRPKLQSTPPASRATPEGVAADLLFKRRPPKDEAEAEAVIDHSEAAAGKLARADQPSGNEVAGNDWPPFAAVLGCERRAGARDVARQDRDLAAAASAFDKQPRLR